MLEENIELKKRILQLLVRMGDKGVTREMFYQSIHGLGYNDLKKMLEKLENDGFIYFEWTDTARFFVYITEKGKDYLKATGFLKDAPKKTMVREKSLDSIERI